MSQKIVQYLNEAHATETALVRVLQSQIAMTPRGSYRSAIERHLKETQDHARRVEQRLKELGDSSGPLSATIGVVESVLGQVIALSKTPLDLLRSGTDGEEKVLKNARDTCATEALEIATYLSLEEAAKQVGDDVTAKLAREIRADEERMLKTVENEIPALTQAVLRGEGYDITKTGAAEAVKRTTKRAARTTGLSEPWRGYDKQTTEEITKRIARADEQLRSRVLRYERTHKNRATITEAADREPAAA
jgi:ferritin-like metal-binding protein YciE